MKSFLLVPKESIETQARPGVRGTAQGERVLSRSTALRFGAAQKAPDALTALGLRSATLPGVKPEVSGQAQRGRKGARGRKASDVDATPMPGAPVTEQAGTEAAHRCHHGALLLPGRGEGGPG